MTTGIWGLHTLTTLAAFHLAPILWLWAVTREVTN